MTQAMTTPPVPPSEDESHLNLLAVFHYIFGGLVALGGCCPIFHFLFGIGMMTGMMPMGQMGPGGPMGQNMRGPAPFDRPPAQVAPDQPRSNQGPGLVPSSQAPEPSIDRRQINPSSTSSGWSQAKHNRELYRSGRHAHDPTHGPDRAGKIFGAVMAVFAVAIMIIFWATAILLVIAGRCLQRKKAHTFCMVIGALECLWVPFGTVLGVFTLVVLNRPNVKAMFEKQPTANPYQAK